MQRARCNYDNPADAWVRHEAGRHARNRPDKESWNNLFGNKQFEER